MEPEIALEVVEKADLFVQTVTRVFELDELSLETESEDVTSNRDDKEANLIINSKIEEAGFAPQSVSLEEIRREARENWLRSRRVNSDGTVGLESGKAPNRDPTEEH